MTGKTSWQLDLINDHAAGAIDDAGFAFIADQRLGRRVHLDRCPACMRLTLVGLDANRCALTARVDPYAITALGEVAALRAGRATYRVSLGQLDRRDRWNIPGNPPSHQATVLVEHDCTGIPDTWRMPPRPPRPQPKVVDF